MASSSSRSPRRYDVFISFRGEDTRANFTSHLHSALSRNKIEAYIDYRLEKGKEVWPSLVKAIEDSTLFLVIFSQNYASSTRCLNELAKILQCTKDERRFVIPVFYKIDPSHVRKQTGSYSIAFAKHEQSGHKQLVYKWREALTEAANIAGWDCSAYRNESNLVGEIVKDVLIKLDSMDQCVYLDDFIGIHDQMAQVESLMSNESQDVRFIGIWGMGGIGKTTIAKALFDELCFAFESFCFLDNVREESEKYGIVHLKNKLLSCLLEDKESYIGMPDGGSSYARRRLGRKKVLVVLDDVSDSEQLKNLAGAHHWFGQGSRVIITTRDKQVLGKNVDYTYKVKALEFGEAFQLFNLNAFKNNCLDEEFEQLSRDVVDYAQGIPLALIVLGSLLYGKSKEEWKSQLDKLKKMPNMKVQQILRLSYDVLDHEEKNIFLHVACFFKGRRAEHITTLLDACGYSTTIGLKVLQDKALLSIFNGDVSMHDLIQEMGWEIVRQESLEDPGKRSRLWDAKDIYQVLKDNKGSEAIKSISLDMSKMEELNLSSQVFSKMPNLVFLEIYNFNSERHSFYLPQGLGSLSNKLRYLRYDNFPLKFLPLTFSAESLVELEMQQSRMRKLWNGVQNVVNLKVINLQDSKDLMELPDLSKAINLEEIDLSNCASLRKVHPSILSLDKIQILKLNHCVALTSLRSDIPSRSLSHLILDGCSNLKEFSVISYNMKALYLERTSINELPPAMGCMLKLERLHLNDCRSLNTIQSNLFDGLSSLQELELNGCCNIFEVINHISMLSSLTLLSIKDSEVECLPASIKHLSSLKYLWLNKCTKLRSLPQLPPSIIDIDAIDCSSLETVQFTSEVAEPFKEDKDYSISTSFVNCVKLDQNSVKAILENSWVRLNKFLSEKDNLDVGYQYYLAEAIYPGSRIPKWFKYRTSSASITIDLSSASLSTDWVLIFCVIIPPFQMFNHKFLKCKGSLQIIADGKNVFHYSDSKPVYVRNYTLDHVCLWCHETFSSKIRGRIKESKASSNLTILLKLDFDCDPLEIKEYGVCPTYACEYQNFIKETLPPKQESKDLIFPALPTATWKTKTQGLKDIIYP